MAIHGSRHAPEHQGRQPLISDYPEMLIGPLPAGGIKTARRSVDSAFCGHDHDTVLGHRPAPAGSLYSLSQ
jgi:hypothetical protein